MSDEFEIGSNEQFSAMSEDEDKLFIICMTSRPGIQIFLVDLEYNKFIPGTPLNDRFELIMKKWQDMHWVVISVPIKYKDFVFKVAKRNEMHIVDGVPMMLGGPKGQVSFPLQGDNVFTLENATDSKVYDGLSARQQLECEEKEKCEAIISKHMRTLGKMCLNCGCFHDDTFAACHPDEAEQLREVCVDFDPTNKCMLCRNPVERLSMGGPDICAWCDCGRDPKVRVADRHAYYRK